jgi:hypothetical protein
MTASSNSVRSIKHQPSLNELSPTSPACVIEFFEARQRLLTDYKRIAHETEIDRLVHESAVRRGRYVGVPDTVEEGLYWLIAAAVFASLALGIFGL